MPLFSHLHVHTQFSLLDGAASISSLFKKAAKDNMPAVAITDHGNMFGVFDFVAEAGKHKLPNGEPIKPIVGCEFYLVNDRTKKQFTRDDKDKRYHQLFLAKNELGYKNLTKLCSLGFIEGQYGKYPRIDKELVLKYHEGLIATTCCLGAEVPQAILQKGEKEAEKIFKWWLDIFGEDYYVELQRHKIPEQEKVNRVLLEFAKKYNVKIIASNDSHYLDREDSNAHDILLCINTQEKQKTPKMKDFSDDDVQAKGARFAFYNDEFFFKTTDEMSDIFKDLPQAIDNTNEIVSKVDRLKLTRDILLPNFPIPPEFKLHQEDTLNQWEYLKYMTFEGARKRYIEVSAEIEERINFELFTVKTMGFAGYFLIVADFIAAGRDIGVFVGPGRGSAAGSVIAYCIGITNIDPIKYNLLFERFLNPDRKSLPDIDTDFDDEGRGKVIDYVVKKYGKSQVAHIVTYGTMAAKMSIKDVARALDLPIAESNALTALVPDKPGITLKRVIHAPLEGEKSLKEIEGLTAEVLDKVKKFREIYNDKNLPESNVLKEAEKLEGSVRNTGIHAAGIIIAPYDLTDILPVFTAKDSDLWVTQFEGKIIEDAGVIKMDFLGLKNLSILKDALRSIKENHGVEIDIDTLPLDDEKTYQYYQRGDTNGTFQFESPGMQKYLRDLKPDKFEDLIAMNALYRPGPIDYIPSFIKRKHGLEPVVYDLPEVELYLHETYGITVYQEQVMLLSQSLAGFTKGDADVLRKAMGKKDRKTLDKMKPQFIEGATKKGLAKDKLEKIWVDWEAFASYAFNKSHSTCYAMVAFQTMYLKAHYGPEYMAAVLTHNQNNTEKLTFYMEECKRLGIEVLGPDVNESKLTFSATKKGKIRFGLGGIKGVGEGPVEAIIEGRTSESYGDVLDFICKVNLKSINKRTFESLVMSGSFDFDEKVHRAQYFYQDENGVSTIERILRYGSTFRDVQNSSHQTLFGEQMAVHLDVPKIPVVEPWTLIEKLDKERDVIGIYLSGHPLSPYKYVMDNLTIPISKVAEINSNPLDYRSKEVKFAGIVTKSAHRITKNNKEFGSFTIEDQTGKIELAIFGEDYKKMKHLLGVGEMLFVNSRVEERKFGFNGSGHWELKVSKASLLCDSDKMIKGVKLVMPLSYINQEFMDFLAGFCAQNPGDKQLFVNILDDKSGLVIDMKSKTTFVSMDKEFLDSLNFSLGINAALI